MKKIKFVLFFIVLFVFQSNAQVTHKGWETYRFGVGPYFGATFVNAEFDEQTKISGTGINFGATLFAYDTDMDMSWYLEGNFGYYSHNAQKVDVANVFSRSIELAGKFGLTDTRYISGGILFRSLKTYNQRAATNDSANFGIGAFLTLTLPIDENLGAFYLSSDVGRFFTNPFFNNILNDNTFASVRAGGVIYIK